MSKVHILALGVALGLVGGAGAQTVSVSQSGTPDFSTIQAAIDSFTPDPDANAANVIQIADNAVYKEVITVDVPVTIEGSSALDRPTVVPGVSSGDGILISVATGTFNDVTLRNLIVIPDPAAPVTDDLIVSVGQNLNILLDNLVITANNGSDQPVTLTGMAEADLTGATQIGDDGIFVGGTATPAGDGTIVTLRNTVISHVTGDGMVCSGTGEAYVIEDGCVFSYNGRLGIQANGDFDINAATDRVWVLGNKGFAGLWYAGATGTDRTVNNANVVNNTAVGIEQQNGGDLPFSLTNSIVAGNGTVGLIIADVGTAGAVTISNSTIARNGSEPLTVNAAATGAISVTDSVITGSPTQPGQVTVVHDGTAQMTISDSALVTNDLISLATPPTSGTGDVVTSNITSDDPVFVSTDYTSSDYLDVDNPAYGGAGSGGSDLSGGADYIGSFVEPTSADKWNLYQ